jgi:hypothetical protein
MEATKKFIPKYGYIKLLQIFKTTSAKIEIMNFNKNVHLLSLSS